MGRSASTSTSTSTPYIRVHSWFKSHPSRSPRRADLELESPSYFHSCFIRVSFVFIRGSKYPQRSALTEDLTPESPSYIYSCPFVFIRGSKHPSRSALTADLTPESPSYFYSCPFVSIRGSKNTPREVSAGHISGRKARATFIRVHSCSFVVQNTPHSWFKTQRAKKNLRSLSPRRFIFAARSLRHLLYRRLGSQASRLSL